jgi:hypothetical protein
MDESQVSLPRDQYFDAALWLVVPIKLENRRMYHHRLFREWLGEPQSFQICHARESNVGLSIIKCIADHELRSGEGGTLALVNSHGPDTFKYIYV